jgi:hypothetical protein
MKSLEPLKWNSEGNTIFIVQFKEWRKRFGCCTCFGVENVRACDFMALHHKINLP